MAAKKPQTMAKRAREQAVKERRDRKRAKKADVAARRAAAKQTGTEAAPETDPQNHDPEETVAGDLVEEARTARL